MKLIAAFLALVLILFSVDSYGQSISGEIKDEETGEAVAFANVFFSGTLVGTTSGIDGKFSLKNVGPGKYDLIVSYVGYEEYVATLELKEDDLFLNINLKPKVVKLNEILVNADTSGWKNNYASFKPLFLGETINAQKVKITNPRDIFLFYDQEEKGLYAHAKNEIIVENLSLGYKIKYIMKDFSMNYGSGLLKSYGIPRFEELIPKGKRQAKRWQKEREKTFNGSFQHFLKVLKENRIEEEGYEVYELHRIPNPKRPDQDLINVKLSNLKKNAQTVGRLVISSKNTDSLRYWRRLNRLPKEIDSIGTKIGNKSALLDNNNRFNYTGYLKIIYRKEPEQPGFARTRPGGGVDNKQTSTIIILDSFQIYDNGYYDVTKVFFEGYMGWASRLAEMLPLEYKPILEN